MLSSRLAKLAAMPWAELRHRAGYRLFLAWERQAVQYGVAGARRPRLGASDAPGLTFFPSLFHRDETRRLLAARFAENASHAAIRAEKALGNQLEVFGRTWDLGAEIDWHRTPGAAPWPKRFHADVPVTGAEADFADVKEIWELNRHQVLLDLGKTYFLCGDPRYAAKADDIVQSWVRQNPYAVGVNWAGPLEVAYRALSWSWAYGLVGRALTAEARSVWLEGFENHGRFLHRHLEAYSSPYNHLIGEAAVLFLLSACFPAFPAAPRWRRRAREVLEGTVERQFYDDGGSVEQATGYHHATLGFYLLAALAGRLAGDELSPRVWEAIERAIDFSMRLMQPDGCQPGIGDNDDARPISFERVQGWDYRLFQCLGAVLFARGDFKAAAAGLREEALWLLGPNAARAFDELEPAGSTHSSELLASSGYAVLRDEPGDYVLFDCGEQAGGLRHDGVPSAAHGHSDALAVVASLHGQPVLVDAGFFTYNGERAWERHFRETAAHNTIRIDRLDQSHHLEKMAWSHAPVTTIEGWHTSQEGTGATASHDGYMRLPNPVVHRRTVLLRRGSTLVLADEIVGDGAHDVELVLQLAPGLPASIAGSYVDVAGGRFSISWSASAAITPFLSAGRDGDPAGGWVANALGTREPAARLVLATRATGTLRILTVVAPGPAWSSDGLGSQNPQPALTGCRHGVVEHICFSADRPDGSTCAHEIGRGTPQERVETRSGVLAFWQR